MRPIRSLVCIVCLTAVLAAPTTLAAASPRDDMIGAVNKVRARHGLPALKRSPSLVRSSQAFSRRMMASDRFGHAARVSASRRFRRLGEALELHGGRRLSIRGTVRGWMASPGHRAVILTRSMRLVGAGVTRGRFGSGHGTIWVLQTGRR